MSTRNHAIHTVSIETISEIQDTHIRPERLTGLLRDICLGVGHKRRTMDKAAQMLRIGRPALSNLLNGRAELSIKLAVRIELAFGYRASELLYLQTRLQLAKYIDKEIVQLPITQMDEVHYQRFVQGAIRVPVS